MSLSVMICLREDEDMLKLYSNIKWYRTQNGMSQSELAAKVGYADKTMISRIENGLVDLPQSKIEEFAKVFGIEPGVLMGWTDTLQPLRERILQESQEDIFTKRRSRTTPPVPSPGLP